MLNWISAHSGDLIIGLTILVIVGLIIRSLIKQHKAGGACSSCSFASKCDSDKTCNCGDLSLTELQKVLDQQDAKQKF